MDLPFAIRRLGFRLLRFVPGGVSERAVHFAMPSFMLGAMGRIVRDDGRVLLVKPAYRQHWILPGGLLERGEDPLTGLHREVLEETGLRIDVDPQAVVLVDPSGRIVDFVFDATVAADQDPDALLTTAAEIEDLAWVAPELVGEWAGPMGHKITVLDRAAELGTNLLVFRSPDRPAER
jgi:8-oxo-dGTP diphosphatase